MSTTTTIIVCTAVPLFLSGFLNYYAHKTWILYFPLAGILLLIGYFGHLGIVSLTASQPDKTPTAIENKPIVVPKPPTPLAMSPSDIIAQAVADRQMSQMSTGGSGGIQPDFGSTYEGQYVEWQLYLGPNSVKQSLAAAEGDLEVHCSDGGNPEAFVIFNTTSADHVFLRVSIDAGQMFTVTGYIQRVGSSEIWLTGADIQPISATGL